MTTQVFHNAHVLTERGFERDVCVLVEEGFIVAVLHGEPPAGDVIDLQGGYLVPGFIDAQVNGGGGVLFNNDTNVEAIAAIGRAHRRFGTTGFLPTLISDDAEVMQRAIQATRDAIAQGVPGVLGIHLEGPYLAPARKGTHDDAKFRVPDDAEIAMATSLDNGVSLLTLAPERVPADAIRAIVQRGGIVTAGHTAGNYDEIRAGIDAGITGFTHLYNAMTPLQGRGPGAVGAALEGVVVAEILSTAKHPEADRLQVCQVSIGSGEPVQIVCGAPNARAGLKAPLATVGANLPGGRPRDPLLVGKVSIAAPVGAWIDAGLVTVQPTPGVLG